MITISLCMIVKNEENCIRNCLDSIKDVVDEIIIVDTGSTDNTVSIIEEYTDTIYHFTWINDFSAARNYAFSLATKEYILWLDADDVLRKNDHDSLLQLKETLDPSMDIVTMIYDITFNKDGICTLSIPRDKLVRNGAGFYWRYFVHEELVVHGTYYHSDIHVTHTSDHGHYSRYLPNYEQRLLDGFELLPHEKYFYGGELFMSGLYEKCIPVFIDFLEQKSDNSYEIQRSYEYLTDCFILTKNLEKALEYSFRSMQIKAPDLSLCSKIGTLYLKLQQWDLSIFWFRLATSEELFPILNTEQKNLKVAAYIQLCICAYNKNDISSAISYNKQALLLDDSNVSALYNEIFFDTIII